MAFSEDIDDFFDTDQGFAITASYTPDGGSAGDITGIFDDDFLLVDDGQVGVHSSVPTFLTATSNVSSVAEGDRIVINSITYQIMDFKPDGTGMTTCMLSTV